MAAFLFLLSGDPPPHAASVMLVQERPGHGREPVPGSWAIVPGGPELWAEPDAVAEIRADDGAVLRTKDEWILGCLIPGMSPRGGAVRLELAPPGSAALPSISDRQFAQILALDGVISQNEALAWASYGELPRPMELALQSIPEEGGQRFGARMLLASATTYERDHPLVPMLGALLQYDAAALDDIWRRAAAL